MGCVICSLPRIWAYRRHPSTTSCTKTPLSSTWWTPSPTNCCSTSPGTCTARKGSVYPPTVKWVSSRRGLFAVKRRPEGSNIEHYKTGVVGGVYVQYAQVNKHVYSTHNFGLGSFSEAASQSSLVHLYSRGVWVPDAFQERSFFLKPADKRDICKWAVVPESLPSVPVEWEKYNFRVKFKNELYNIHWQTNNTLHTTLIYTMIPLGVCLAINITTQTLWSSRYHQGKIV